MEPLQRKAKPHPRAWARASKRFHAQTAEQLSEDWLDRFAELLTYRQRKGTFSAPPDTELGRWIKHQRQQHSMNKLPVAARARLAGCGFFEPQPLMDASRPLTSGTALRAEQHARLRPGTAAERPSATDARPRISSRPSFDRPGTAASPDPRVRVTSWGDDVPNLSPQPSPERRPKSVRFADRVTGSSETVARVASVGCAWCGRAEDIAEVCGMRLCGTCRRAKTPAPTTMKLVRRSRDAPAPPSDSFQGLALRPLAAKTRGGKRHQQAPELIRVETPAEIRKRRSCQRRRRRAAEEAMDADRELRAAAEAERAARMQQQTPPTVAAMLDGHGGAVTLTVLQKEVGQARPDLYEWLTRDGGKLPVDKGVVPVEGLAEAVAAFDEERRLERLDGEADQALDRALGLVAPAARPRSGWHRASRGFVPGRHRSWTPKTPSRPDGA
jgi:hypothetical protein